MVPMLIVKPEAFSQRIISLIPGSTIPVKEKMNFNIRPS